MTKGEFSKVAGLLYKVPENMAPLITKATQNSFISRLIAANIFGSEGGYKKSDAVSKTGAVGTGQFTEKTFLETVWRYRNDLPKHYRAIIENNVEHHNKAAKGERPIYEDRIKQDKHGREIGNRTAVLDLRKNPEVSILLGVRHMEDIAKAGWENFKHILKAKIEHIESHYNPLPVERLANLKREFGREMTATDLKVFYVCGLRGGAELLAANAETVTQKHKAADYTTQGNARHNRELFQKTVGERGKEILVNRNVPEFIEHIASLVGKEKIPIGKNARHAEFSENWESMRRNESSTAYKTEPPLKPTASAEENGASGFTRIEKDPKTKEITFFLK